MALEARIANLEGTVEQIGQRLNGFDARFNNVERKIDALDGRLSGRIDSLDERMGGRMEGLDRRFTWMMGLLVISIVLPVVERFVLH